jgi:hypothetical protein
LPSTFSSANCFRHAGGRGKNGFDAPFFPIANPHLILRFITNLGFQKLERKNVCSLKP